VPASHKGKSAFLFPGQQPDRIRGRDVLGPDGTKLLISYGIRDCEAWLGSVDADEVRRLLGLGYWLTANCSNDTPTVFGHFFGDDAWVAGQTNRALQERSAIERTRKSLAAHDLPRHPDYPKSWDSCLALWHCGATIADTPKFFGAASSRLKLIKCGK